jgi:hypothetical protein
MASPPSALDELLLAYQGPEADRVRTAILLLAQGDTGRVRYFLECAATDYRDVLWWAEQTMKENESGTIPRK